MAPFSDFCSETCGCDEPCRSAREAALESWRARGTEPTQNERRAIEAADYGDAAGCGDGAPRGALILNPEALRGHSAPIDVVQGIAEQMIAQHRGALDLLAPFDGPRPDCDCTAPGQTCEQVRYDRLAERLTTYDLGPSGEERVIDPTTGGVKGRKLARFDLLPADALHATAEHFGRGASKYADRNWERGYAWGLSYGAMMRHAWAFWGGEDVDEETGSLHLAAVAFHALALLAFQLRGIGTDDRALEVAQ